MSYMNDFEKLKVGVGLRHQHIDEALNTPAAIDFVEVHSENFFSQGGALHHLIQDISQTYPVSLHSTAIGLGSVYGIPSSYLNQLKKLVDIADPILISDHAAFAWGELSGVTVHGGDLLPLVYNKENLSIMCQNIDKVQQILGRQILVENLSAYLRLPSSTMLEQEFLVELHNKTGCGLLIDINNILVNAYNEGLIDHLSTGRKWLDNIPKNSVGEIHLAGFTIPKNTALAIDDHSKPVSTVGWELYAYAIKCFGATPTLIEWDNQLPDWSVLLEQAFMARRIAQGVLGYE